MSITALAMLRCKYLQSSLQLLQDAGQLSVSMKPGHQVLGGISTEDVIVRQSY